MALVVAVVALFALGLYFGERLLERSRNLKPSATAEGRPPAKSPAAARPATKRPPAAKTDRPSEAPPAPAEPPQSAGTPAAPEPAATARIAIVIDDLGRQVSVARSLADLDPHLTFAVLPFEPQSAATAAMLASRGAEVLLHLPMEPEGKADPGPGALSEKMSKREIVAATRKALEAIPSVSGVNNHMGSALTSDRGAMRAVLGVLIERHLFFLDSRTSAESVGFDVARKEGVPTARRDLFLDEVRERAAIESAIDELVELALRRGSAIGIAHPRPETIAALADRLPGLAGRGVELVPVSFLLERSEALPE